MQETLDKIIALESRASELEAIRRKSDDAALKCFKDGLIFREKYPDAAAERDAANIELNEIEEELSILRVQLKEEED